MWDYHDHDISTLKPMLHTVGWQTLWQNSRDRAEVRAPMFRGRNTWNQHGIILAMVKKRLSLGVEGGCSGVGRVWMGECCDWWFDWLTLLVGLFACLTWSVGLIGWLVDVVGSLVWLVDWLTWSVGWFDWLIGWLIHWLVVIGLVGHWLGWLISVDWLVDWFTKWLGYFNWLIDRWSDQLLGG